jgi:hypothetical protein
MKTFFTRFDFTDLSVVCLMARIVAAGFAHFPVFTAILTSAYAVAVVTKLLGGLFSKCSVRPLQAQKGINP